uniref:Co-chaperonin GroES n=1 Tax=mine drainage metagenome TaxID=410659 RepID=E6QP93_9ZZZZ
MIEIAKAPFKLSITEQIPELFEPMGDTYLVHILDIDDSVMAGEHRLVVPQKSTEDRGWKAGVIVAVGNGRCFDRPDEFVVVPNVLTGTKDEMKAEVAAYGEAVAASTDQAVVVRIPAMANMALGVGEVVLIEKFAGRDVVLQGKPYIIVGQQNLLARHKSLRLHRNAEGTWE